VSERSQLGSEGLKLNAKVRLGETAARQFGRARWGQIVELGITRGTIANWLGDGYLYRTLPGVYAVGHKAPSVEAGLADALLYAGHGAMLSHVTALWWLDLIKPQPATIHVSTPGRHRSMPGLKVHAERRIERVFHRGLPITPVPQALLDYSATAPLREVRYVVAEAEYHELLNLEAIDGVLGRGRPGSAKLRVALERHDPRLGRTKSAMERKLLEICETSDIPLPEVNQVIGLQTVDVVWWGQKVVVELDGGQGHSSRAQMNRDRQRDLALRALGFTVIRYTWYQLFQQPELVIADLVLALHIAA
jgi:very-short-patch-repair endonuclease